MAVQINREKNIFLCTNISYNRMSSDNGRSGAAAAGEHLTGRGRALPQQQGAVIQAACGGPWGHRVALGIRLAIRNANDLRFLFANTYPICSHGVRTLAVRLTSFWGKPEITTIQTQATSLRKINCIISELNPWENHSPS